MNYNHMISRNSLFSVWLLTLSGLIITPAVFAQDSIPEAVTEASSQASDSVAEPSVAVAKPAADTDDLDPGMQIPVDGSSLEAFNASLESVKEKATEANYTTLENAIQWFLVYDIGAGGDMAKVAKNLDGLTADEIINKVEWSR